MKAIRNTKKSPINIVSVLIFLLVTSWIFLPVFAQQEGEGPSRAWKWYYRQRAYPYDTIPSGAYEDAIAQRDALRQSSGFQFPGPNSWTPIGPKPFDWVGNGTPYSGRPNNIKYDPREPTGNTIYITGPGVGLWKTTDGGLTWLDKSGDIPTLNIGAFALDTANNILYLGTGALTFYFGDGLGMRIFKSTNDGLNWTSISTGIKPGTSISKIAISPVDPDLIFAATFHGLYKTTNAGANWFKVIPITGADSVCTDVCFSPSGNRVYATGPSFNTWEGTPFNGIGYWRSTDGGNSFVPIAQSSGFPRIANLKHGKTLCTTSKASENFVYLVNFENLGSVYLYKSTDWGSNFTTYYVGNTDIFYHLLVRCSDVNPDTCFVGFESLSRTYDGGQNWTGVTTSHVDNLALDFNPADPLKVTVGCDGGVFISANLGGTWQSQNQNLNLSLFWGLASDPYDSSFVVGGLHDYGYAYKYPQGGQTYWMKTNSNYADGGNMVASPFKSKHFVAAKVIGRSRTEGNPIDYSFDGVNFSRTDDYILTTWTVEFSPFTNHPTEPGTIYTVRFNSLWSPQTVYFYKSTNYGVNWGGSTAWREFGRPTSWGEPMAPTLIAISPSNSDIMIMDFGNAHEWWHFSHNIQSRLIKSTNGGLTWEGIDYGEGPIVTGGQPGRGVPDRHFTDVEFDPVNANEVYLTVSGYYDIEPNGGHVFKSTDGGYNWTNISGSLPDIPVNDIMVHYPDCDTKQLLIATDLGIYVTDASSISWREVAPGFPNTPAHRFNYNRLSGKLRATTWGYGAWEFDISNTVYVQDHLFITDNANINQDIIVCQGGKLILGLNHQQAPNTVQLAFGQGKKIIVQDGGEIDASSGVDITLTSSGLWGGIEFQGTGYGTLRNITFQNTNTPVVINGGLSEAQDIIIDNCIFSAPVSINTRSNVTVKNSHWEYSSPPPGSIACVYSINSNHININSNELNMLQTSIFVGASAIIVLSGESITIVNNNLNKCARGIDIHNCSNASINQNAISGSSEMSSTGIFMDYAYSSTLRLNTVNDFPVGIYIFASSPTLYMNYIDNNGDYGPDPVGISMDNYSFPRLRPLEDEPYQLWDAGYNFIFNESQKENQTTFKINYSLPEVGSGYNRIKSNHFYIDGCKLCDDPYSEYPWLAQYNCWSEAGEPDPGKFHFTDGGYAQVNDYTCDPPPGGGSKKSVVSDKEPSNKAEPAMSPNPQFIIVNRGNGVFDTIKVTLGSHPVTNDWVIYFNGVKNELLANYQASIGLFQQVIQNYQDSLTAILSLKRILTCRDKMAYDSTAYSTLRTYYQQLEANNLTDSAFASVAGELAVKCLVRLKRYQQAIGEYEDIIANSTDSMKILGCELNIIEIYMMMSEGGDSPSFTGKIASLKPHSIENGFKLINEKLKRLSPKAGMKTIPAVFSLSQNYPNPFNASTNINYALPQSAKVELKVYDILGRLVKVVVNEFREAGFYSVIFDASGLASGVYFYMIKAGDFVDSKKMVLVK